MGLARNRFIGLASSSSRNILLALLGLAVCLSRPSRVLAIVGGGEAGGEPMTMDEGIEPIYIGYGTLWVIEIARSVWQDPGHAEHPHSPDFEGDGGDINYDGNDDFGNAEACKMQVQWSDGTPMTDCDSVTENLTFLYNGPPTWDGTTWSGGTSIYNVGALVNGVFIDTLSCWYTQNQSDDVEYQISQAWEVYDWQVAGDDIYTCNTDAIQIWFHTESVRYADWDSGGGTWPW